MSSQSDRVWAPGLEFVDAFIWFPGGPSDLDERTGRQEVNELPSASITSLCVSQSCGLLALYLHLSFATHKPKGFSSWSIAPSTKSGVAGRLDHTLCCVPMSQTSKWM